MWQVFLSLSHSPPWGCALQVSALQQGAGVQDGVAEEEGTVELGPKRLWKVGPGEARGPQAGGGALPRVGEVSLSQCLLPVPPSATRPPRNL